MTALIHLVVGITLGTILEKTLNSIVLIGIHDTYISATVGRHIKDGHCSPGGVTTILAGVRIEIIIKTSRARPTRSGISSCS